MSGIDIINPNFDFELILCKPNKQEIGILSTAKINSLKKQIDDINSLTFSVSDIVKDRFTRNNVKNVIYDEIHEERLINLGDDYYVIKSIDETIEGYKTKDIEAYSLEYKLKRINITLENVTIVLVKDDISTDEVSILDLLKTETGWKYGHIDDRVRFDVIDNKNIAKVRWQESVSDNWYSFLTETIADIFSCVIKFDTKTKTINLYSIDTLGENTGLYLSDDNYVKSIKKQSNTENIVTRLSLVGKDEIDIRSVNPTGKDYIENYSYFIDNDDMSEELVSALNKYQKIIDDNQIQWSKLSKQKNEKDILLIKNTQDFNSICKEINVLISIRDNDPINKDKYQSEINDKEVIKKQLENDIRQLEIELEAINESINAINKQNDREFTIDENGNKLFTVELLDELNEFLYYDNYSNNSYITPNDLLVGGKRELEKICIPTNEYQIDSINFIDRLVNRTQLNFTGTLNLGDIIILYDSDKEIETLLYFVGYEYNYEDKTLNVTFSNKKTKINNTKSISDYLKKAKISKTFVDSKSYLVNQIKYYKI